MFDRVAFLERVSLPFKAAFVLPFDKPCLFFYTVDSRYLDLAYLNNRLSRSENLVPA